ncbi:hypothetical protein TPY_1941 [Sulfobacillus acidophilus TPY]|uniref:DNA binding domain protein, excisionase family n=1 Tax=Sulfobacillus acidophilus (strain ATCC 700253 / DSM 10332 / NAL) TaxID=679936 RepID=G8TT09_SULAD|nr:hypothetical protein TPY_1941 [Sulfobacillus acidophilus TPY]AEW05624.1 DNA binding domain protein, excisionase family [Sulfobacillus acidophilus DSM 10332]
MADDVLIGPDSQDLDTVKRIADDLVAHPNTAYVLMDNNHGQVPLPAPLVRVLLAAAQHLAKGHSVSILHYEQELTTQQAADLLQVSRPYLIRLLDEGKIRFHRVGSHRRIRLGDLLDYKNARDRLRKAHLQELVRASEALGLYASDDVDERES